MKVKSKVLAKERILRDLKPQKIVISPAAVYLLYDATVANLEIKKGRKWKA